MESSINSAQESASQGAGSPGLSDLPSVLCSHREQDQTRKLHYRLNLNKHRATSEPGMRARHESQTCREKRKKEVDMDGDGETFKDSNIYMKGTQRVQTLTMTIYNIS